MASERSAAELGRVEPVAYRRLYETAAARYGTGWHVVAGVQCVWLPGFFDPDASCVTGLETSTDPLGALAEVERAARTGGASVLGINGTPALLARLPHEQLEALGYRRDYLEHMWVRSLAPALVEQELPVGMRVESVAPPAAAVFARTLNLGFEEEPDTLLGLVFATTAGHANWRHYLCLIDDQPAAAAVLAIVEDVAHLFFAGTVPAFRGRGAQTALIQRRLRDGLAAGCSLATSLTVADNASPRNMARHGFEKVYDRWLYRKDMSAGEFGQV
jgi:hypothetical protein